MPMINVTDEARIKLALLKQLDQTLREQYHQSLSDVLTDLRIRNVLVEKNPTPEYVFELMLQTQVLGHRSGQNVTKVRQALERFTRGSFKTCARCGKEMPVEVLEHDPTADRCASCQVALTN